MTERRAPAALWDARDASLTARTRWGALGEVRRLAEGSDAYACDEEGGAVCAGAVPFGLGGAWRSPVTGWSQMRARFYAPGLGQFVSRDPLGLADSADPYAYVGFDPLNRWDPSGLAASSIAGALADGAGYVWGGLSAAGGAIGDALKRMCQEELLGRTHARVRAVEGHRRRLRGRGGLRGGARAPTEWVNTAPNEAIDDAAGGRAQTL